MSRLPRALASRRYRQDQRFLSLLKSLNVILSVGKKLPPDSGSCTRGELF